MVGFGEVVARGFDVVPGGGNEMVQSHGYQS